MSKLLFAALIFFAVTSAAAQPVIESIDPPYGPPDTVAVLSGSDLAIGDPTVAICGNDAGPVQVLPGGRVQFQTPKHAMGIAMRCDVTLINMMGESTLEKAYTYYAPPPISIRHRNFLMGFVPLLLGPSDDPVRLYWYWYDARQIAANLGDIVSILYSVWDNCDGGIPHLPDLTPAIDQTKWFHEQGIKVFLGLESTTGYRDNVGYCPGDTYAAPHVREDFESQVRFLFEAEGPGYGEINYPDYLLLGIEMNMYYLARPSDWDNYKSLLDRLYQVVREYTDKTKIIVSFQFDVMASRWLWPLNFTYPRQWEIYRDLAVDTLGISVYQTFMHLLCSWDPSWMGLDMFHWFTDPEYNPRQLPIAVTETGYSGMPRGPNFIPCGSDLHQHSYLVRIAEILEKHDAEFLIWWSLHEGSDPNASEFFRSMRLVTQDRECYPDCYPYEPGCIPECPLDPKGGLALATWKSLFNIQPGQDDDSGDDDSSDDDSGDDDTLNDDTTPPDDDDSAPPDDDTTPIDDDTASTDDDSTDDDTLNDDASDDETEDDDNDVDDDATDDDIGFDDDSEDQNAGRPGGNNGGNGCGC